VSEHFALGHSADRTGLRRGAGGVLPPMRRILSRFAAFVAGRVAGVVVCVVAGHLGEPVAACKAERRGQANNKYD